MENANKPAFASSASATTKITCPACSAQNPSDSKFCLYCGQKLPAKPAKPVFNDIVASAVQEAAQSLGLQQTASNNDDNEQAVFANELPAWNIEPPFMPVRRKHK